MYHQCWYKYQNQLFLIQKNSKINMNKLSLYAIWKSDYKLSDFLISQIIKKHLKITDVELFLLSEITN